MNKENSTLSVGRWLASFACLWVLMSSASAEDIEIFADDVAPTTPNILLVLDHSDSMNYDLSSSCQALGTCISRLDSLRDAFNTLLSDPELSSVNIGMMGFSDITENSLTKPYVHGVAFPVSSINSEAQPIVLSNLSAYVSSSSFIEADDTLPDTIAGESVRAYLPRILETWTGWGNTPLVESFHEAALYFRGDKPKWGIGEAWELHGAHPSTYTGNTDATITYNSPMVSKCESNAIVLLTDGEPVTREPEQIDQTETDIKAMANLSSDCVPDEDTSTGAGRCGPELASFLATKDQNAALEGDNFIKTYTIGFDVDVDSKAETFLKAVAESGEGEYFPASDAAALAAVFKSIITDVSSPARSYASPTYTVDPSSRLAHSRNLYIPLFESSAAPTWSGNLKKFKLNDLGQIIDSSGNVAVTAEGTLDPNATDFWDLSTTTASTEEINPVTSGGIANLIEPGNRKLFTNNNHSLLTLDSDSATRSKLRGDGTSVSEDYQDTLVKYIQGYNDDGTSRHHIGDILHSKPSVVAYEDKEVIFFGTNEGFLHAINSDDASTSGDGGKELFAFMPLPLLGNIRGQYENALLTGSVKRIYGVDGEITIWMDDTNNNRKVDNGESAYLFFGLRRGGEAYYALDISDPENPELLWTISDQTSDFSQLGQTWSKPTMGKLRYLDSGSEKFKEVLVFGGGYDASVYDEETPSSRSTSNVKGNGVYIVNAKSGKLIWSYVGGELKDSVPGNIRTMDIDRNGSIDRLYFGDTGGNVWRVDLNIDDFDSDVSMYDVTADARIYKFAELGQNAGSDTRKFFYEPDVALFQDQGKNVSLITIGSGYRSHPSNINIEDRVFVLYDENALNIPETAPQPITDSDLASSSALAGNSFLPNYKGWYKDLTNGQGEKSLSSPLIFMNKLVFTTFGLTDTTSSTTDDSCTVSANNFGRAYVLDLMTGSATTDLDGDGTITSDDESVTIGSGEIPDSPDLVFNRPSNCTTEGCDHFVDVRVGTLEKPLIDENTADGNVNIGEFLPKVYWVNSPS